MMKKDDEKRSKCERKFYSLAFSLSLALFLVIHLEKPKKQDSFN